MNPSNDVIKVIVCDDSEGADADWAVLVEHAGGDGGPRLEMAGSSRRVPSAREAIAVGKTRRAHVVLVDLVMPIVEGGKRVVAGPWIARALSEHYARPDSPHKTTDDPADPRPAAPALVLWTSNPLETVGCEVRAFMHLGGRHVVDKQQSVQKQVELIRSIVLASERWRPEPDGVTDRLRQLLAMMIAGVSKNEIAARWIVAPGTVEDYITVLRRNLGASAAKAKGAGPLVDAARRKGVTWVPYEYTRDPGDDPLALAR